MSSAAFTMLRKLYPQARITLLTSPACSEILFDPKILDAVISDTFPQGFLARQFYKIKILFHCLKARYDACFFIDHPKRRSIGFYKSAGIPIIVAPGCALSGEAMSSMRRLATHAIPMQAAIEIHNTDYYQDIVCGFNWRGERQSPYLVTANIFPSTEIEREGGTKVAFCFRGRPSNPHRWPMEYFKILTDRLLERGCYLYSAVPAEDYPEQKKLLDAHSIKAKLFATPNLTGCLELLSAADLLISVNTGQTHLAAALGVPVVSLTGPDASSTYPYGANGLALSTVRNCYHCRFQKECPKKRGKMPPSHTPRCILDLTPEKVLPYVEAILNGQNRHSGMVLVGE